MSRRGRPNVRVLVAGTLAAVLLGAATTVGLAAASGAFGGPAPAGTRCAAPTLPGTVVDVTLVDMGGTTNGPMPHGPMMPGRRWGIGMARVFASPDVVEAGTVSFRVVNRGAQTHELVVLPLPAGQAAGERTVGADGRVDEAGSLGEASRTCGGGAGDGIASGAAGWVTLTLRPGRYELVCNLPGHYQAGMYAELDVT